MAPFAGYDDFDACVAANGDKADPRGYCATVKARVEGGGGGDHRESIIRAHFEEPVVAPLVAYRLGIEVFRAGDQTDSAGNTKTWSVADLDEIIAAFNDHVPHHIPLKVSHTTDQFNTKLATGLQVPTDLL